MEQLQAVVEALVKRIDSMETTLGNQGKTIEEFRASGNKLEVDMQTNRSNESSSRRVQGSRK